MKTYKQRTEDIIKKAEKQKKVRKTVTISAISATACAAVVAFSCVLFVSFDLPETSIDAYKNSEYFSVIKPLNTRFEVKSNKPVYKNNFEKWTAVLKDAFSVKGTGSDMMNGAGANSSAVNSDTAWDGDVEYDADEAIPGNGMDTTDAPLGSDEGDENTEVTDNQVAGVIEADLFKRTKTHIFYLSPKQDNYSVLMDGTTRNKSSYVLRVYSIAGENSKQVGEYVILPQENRALQTVPEMYLSADGKTVTIVATSHKYGARNVEVFTEVITLDVSVPTQVKEMGRTYLSGNYVSSRSVNGKLLIVNNFDINKMPDFNDYATYIPQYGDDLDNLEFVDGEDIVVPETIESYRHTVVMELDQTTGDVEDCMALYCYSTDLYVSQNYMYFTRGYTSKDDMESMTDIVCVSYSDEGFAQVGNVTVEGSVLNQYSMDEYDRVFRVVTSVYRPYTSASIYCIDMDTWEIIGSVEEFSPKGEDVQSVRFDKEKAYVCTAEIITLTDPVYAFNLSDPTNITYKDTGVIEGYSSSLVQFYDGYLLGIGFNDERSLKVEIYKETEDGVEIVATYEQKDAQVGFPSEYKAYFIDRSKGFVGLCVNGYEYKAGRSYYEYLLLGFDGYDIYEAAAIPLEIIPILDYTRATMIDGYLYVFGAEFHVEKIY